MKTTDNLLGIVGGLGPLASAEFLKTIYEHWVGALEQESPRVLLCSDPTFPDRTESLLNGSEEQLLEKLIATLTCLREMGASRFVICCFTIHHLLPRVPHELRSRLVSLIDVVYEELNERRVPHLLLCTLGTRRLGTFERHELWPQLRHLFVVPDEMDQHEVHRLIYEIKSGADVRRRIAFIENLLDKYNVNSFIAGCTEIHLLAKHFCATHENERRCIDPLIYIARQLASERQIEQPILQTAGMSA